MKIEDLIKKGESESLEFKESFDSSAIETAVAFANASGGVILVGVSDAGHVRGVTIGKETLKNWVNQVSQATEPTILPGIAGRKVDGNVIVEIAIKESPIKPVACKGVCYLRVKNSNRKLTPKEVAELHLQSVGSSWDGYSSHAKISDLDEKKVIWFLRTASVERRLEVDSTMSVKEALNRLDLIKGSSLTNAAILLFGKNPQRFFPQAETRCARFKGTEPLEFIDMKVFSGNIISQRDDAIGFVKEHIQLHAKIVGTNRVEELEYPIEAIREAITNAICHRDYGTASNVQIRIFDDRMEVWGCGSLPKPLTTEDLKKKHDSVLRNQLIGKCFFLVKFIEQWGTGTNRIIRECLKHGLPEPLFEEIAGSLVVTFRKDIYTEDYLKGLGLNERQTKAIIHAKGKGKITNKEYQEICITSERTATRDLSDLVSKGLLRQIGITGKGTWYAISRHKGATDAIKPPQRRHQTGGLL